jgi:L-fuconolactonase
MSDIIDAHQHFWQFSQPFNYEWLKAPDKAPICRDYLPQDLAPHLAACGVNRTIFVQTQHDLQENRWVLGLTQQHPWIAGIVGWVDLGSLDCEAQLLEFKEHPKFVGVRHITHDEPDDDFIIRPEVLRGLSVLERYRVPFDLLFFVKHLRHAAALARRFPDLPLVIDHLAKPRIKDQSREDWLPAFREAAACPNVFCKLSGMVTEANWQNWNPTDLEPYVQSALELFGPARCMYGSDWPVCELAGSYEAVFRALETALGPLSDHERAQIFGGTAKRFYGLKDDG